jgi:hypothetical protein
MKDFDRTQFTMALFAAIMLLAVIAGGGLLIGGICKQMDPQYITIKTSEGDAHIYGPGRFEAKIILEQNYGKSEKYR